MRMTLKALRHNKGLKQKEACKFLGVTQETVGKWENAKTFPDVPHIKLIEKLYNVKYEDINFLLEDPEEVVEEVQE